MAETLESEGVHVVAVSEKHLLRLMEPIHVMKILASHQGISLTMTQGGVRDVPWERCLLLAGMALEKKFFKQKAGLFEVDDISIYKGRKFLSQSTDEFEEKLQAVPLVELLTMSPLERYRWTVSFSYDLLYELIFQAPENTHSPGRCSRIIASASAKYHL